MTTQIRIVRDREFAPCSFLIVRVLPDGTLPDYRRDESASVLSQSDWDWPSLARDFGWDIASVWPVGCGHESTDGTIPCERCGTKPGAFICEARAYLCERAEDGKTVEDPGYFDT